MSQDEWVQDPTFQKDEWVQDPAFAKETGQEPQSPPEPVLKSLARSTIDTVLPVAGAVGAGMLATPESFGLATVPAGALGYATGKQGARLLNHYLLGDELPAQTASDVAIQTGGDLAEGAMGEMTGLALGKGLDLAKTGVQKAGAALKDVAEKTAFKSGGAMLKDFRTASDRGQVNKLGRFMLDNNLTEAGDTFADVAAKAKALNEKAGSQLDDVYKAAVEQYGQSAKSAGFDPIRDKQSVLAAAERALGDDVRAKPALKNLSTYLDDIAEKYAPKGPSAADVKYARDTEEYKKAFRQFVKERAAYRKALGKAGDDLSQPALSGMIDDLQRKQWKLRQIELNGAPASTARISDAIPVEDTFLAPIPQRQTSLFNPIGGDDLLPMNQQMALENMTKGEISSLGKQASFENLDLTPRSFAKVPEFAMGGEAGQTKMLLPPQAPIRPVKPDARQALDPRTMQNIKTALDQEIRYSRNPLAKEPANEKAYYAARTEISKAIDDAISAMGGEGALPALKSANAEYGMSKQIMDIANDRANREAANRAFGLTDTIAGGAGAAAGATVGGASGSLSGMLLGAGANKIARSYGPAAIAQNADKISKYLLTRPHMADLARRNPKAFQAAVISMTNRISDAAAPRVIQKAAERNELDRDSSTPAQQPRVSPEDARKQFMEGM